MRQWSLKIPKTHKWPTGGKGLPHHLYADCGCDDSEQKMGLSLARQVLSGQDPADILPSR